MATTTLRTARDRYLDKAGLSTDSYVEDWLDVRVGPVPLRLPSPEARKRVLPLHDLHHALTGYQADWVGEAEIGAWELGSGLGRHWIGYMLDLLTLAWAPLVAPRRVWKAFVRGRNSRNFYRAPLPLDPAVLERDLQTVRREFGLAQATPAATMGDRLAFVGWYLAAIPMSVVGLLALPMMVALGVWGMFATKTVPA